MIAEKYITSSVLISGGSVYKDGKLQFEKKGELPVDFLIAAYHHFGLKYPKFYKMDNLAKLGWLSAEILLTGNFNKEKYKPSETGVVLSNASSSLDTDIRYYDTVKDMASPALFVYTLPNIVIGEICISNHFTGENAFFIFEEFDVLFVEQYVSNLLNNNILQSCICGWVEFLEDRYRSAFFLVEKENSGEGLLFSSENLNKIYQLDNG